MSKFQVGDRVKCVSQDGGEELTPGKVYTVTGFGRATDVMVEGSDLSWNPRRFELYAKAGEFVVGDRVVRIDEPGPVHTVLRTASGLVIATEDACYFSYKFRLATPEEIAAAEMKPSPAMFPDSIHPTLANLEIATRAHERAAEIPAADFDFDQIKAGDEVLLRLKASSDGLDKDGEVRVEGGSGFYRYFKPEQILAVIPAPKPKALRERAIEAATSAAYVADSGRLKSHEQLASVVDAVLAEVEKGQ